MTAARQSAFSGVVCRLDVGDGGKGPECGPELEQVVGEPARESVPLSFRSPFEQPAHLPFDRLDAFLEGGAVAVFLELLPGLEDGPGELEAVQAEGFLRSESEVGVEGEVAAQV